MISRDFIHEYDDICMVESAYENHMMDIREIMSGLKIQKVRLNDMKEFDLLTESAEDYFEESVSSAITALGEKIIKIIKDLKNYLTEFVKNLNPSHRKAKEVERKMEELARKDPVAVEQLKILIKDGDITITDIKELDSYFDNVEKLVEDIRKSKINPKSLQGRWEKIKKKVNDNKGTIATIGALLGVALTTTGLVLKWQQVSKGKSEKIINQSDETAKKTQIIMDKIELEQQALEAMARGNINANGVNTDELSTRAGMLAAISADVSRRTKLQTMGLKRIYDTIIMRLDSFYTSRSRTANSRREDNLNQIRRSKQNDYSRYEQVRDNNAGTARRVGELTRPIREEPHEQVVTVRHQGDQDVYVHNVNNRGRNNNRGRGNGGRNNH